MTSQSRGADTNKGLVVSILGQLTQLHAHQADEARVVLVPCAARILTKTSHLHLSLRVLNFSEGAWIQGTYFILTINSLFKRLKFQAPVTKEGLKLVLRLNFFSQGYPY